MRDIRKMLTDKDVSSEIKAKLGMAQFDEMLNWVEAIANPASQRDSKDNSLNSIGQWVQQSDFVCSRRVRHHIGLAGSWSFHIGGSSWS